MELTKEQIEYWLERKCQENGCWNLAEKGYVYCVNHLHGFPEKLPQEVIDYLSEHGFSDDGEKLVDKLNRKLVAKKEDMMG